MNQSVLAPLARLAADSTPGLVTLTRTPTGAVAWIASRMAQEWGRPVVILASKNGRAEAIHRELLFFTRQWRRPPLLLPFPAWETLPFEQLSPFAPLVGERIATLFRLTQLLGLGPMGTDGESGPGPPLITTTPAALTQRLMPRQLLAQNGFAVAMGDRLDPLAFRQFLSTVGYRGVSSVESAGEFAVRGGILDFFPPGHDDPVRIELDGDTVETIRLFDPVSQRSTDRIPRLQALPASEVLFNESTISHFRTHYRSLFGGDAALDERYKLVSKGLKPQGIEQLLPLFYATTDTFFDYLPPGTLFLLEDDWETAALEREREILERRQLACQDRATARCLEPESFYLPVAELYRRLSGCQVVCATPQESLPPGGLLSPGDKPESCSLDFRPVPAIAGKIPGKTPTAPVDIAKILHELGKQGQRIGLAVRTVGQMERLREMLLDHQLTCTDLPHWEALFQQPSGTVGLVVGDLGCGFIHEPTRIALLTEEDLFGERLRRRRPDRHYLDQLIASFAGLAEGDYVVHVDHGIGRYGGLHPLEVGTLKNDYLLIIYADEDRLYVPVENLDQVSKYSGGEEVLLDKLGSNRWEKTKERARKKIMEMASELVAIQAKRQLATGIPFAPADALSDEFAALFPFEETPDQAQAIATVLEDMASPRPMDRLVCGDVGFGKTEVALRAAFLAVMDGKQVAVLVPTTILAQQHHETFSRRMEPYPIRVELLSRFRSAQELKKTIEAVQRGEVDIVIGTHRLLQKDIAFKALGLLVVDEEQRFGVTHKERIKQLRASVDILTLTATPIPRTLHLAMAGVRDISIIATPPSGRLAIRTIVTQYDRQQVREAILRELYRGGQVFYVYNRVSDIDKTVATLMELAPEARIGVAHGQMPELQLEKTMLSFYRREFDLLVCTTIIENGVDIPSANTIIIHRADKFGLAQLHQLRGRVGRSKHRAYAYFLVPPAHQLSEIAGRRLEAISTLGDLGAGFLLATHDLEIRGAGNILGDEQSGQIREVGFELYNQMLAEAVQAIQATEGSSTASNPTPAKSHWSPAISLNLSLHIPGDYIADVTQRLTLYKRIADLTADPAIEDMKTELIDRFGPLPPSVSHLLRVVKLKQWCRQLKIARVEAGPKGGSLQFLPDTTADPATIIDMVRSGGSAIRFQPDTRTLTIRHQSWDDPLQRLDALGSILARFLRPDVR